MCCIDKRGRAGEGGMGKQDGRRLRHLSAHAKQHLVD